LDGGAGNDTATYMDADGGVAASLWLGWGWEGDANGDRFSSIENLQGGAYNDTLAGDNYENVLDGLGGDDNLSGGNKADTLLGGEGNDSLYGENHADVLDGGEGDDYLDGGNHTDMLYGGDGNDTLDGGLQRDTLNGGAGDDYLIGGKQNDVFEFTDLGDVDEIADFDRGRDSIDVSGLGVSDWIGSNTFSGSAGEIRAFKSG
ncbi:MAG: M10 family metallopeptidase C-terminal domain-containing protein, partial [Rhodobacteraceae bacterium]|nr:M10 family metallopeptidase C-terminal domain-containing protein [Paracoccaceae bacterium]